MKLTTRAEEITRFALSLGMVIAQDLEDRTLHITKTTHQGTWMERELFRKMERFNNRLGKRWQDSWQ